MSDENKLCDIGDDIKEELKKFRFRKSTARSALILKVDREKQKVVLDEFHEDISVEDLRDELPGHQPRYVVYSYRMEHDDKRVSYPICFIFYTPRDSRMDLQMLYAGTKSALVRVGELTRVFEIRELDEFTEEWLHGKLK